MHVHHAQYLLVGLPCVVSVINDGKRARECGGDDDERVGGERAKSSLGRQVRLNCALWSQRW
jgi:hypothetical protein